MLVELSELVELSDNALANQIPPTIATTSTTAIVTISGVCLTVAGFAEGFVGWGLLYFNIGVIGLLVTARCG